MIYMNVLAFDTVSDKEISKLLGRQEFKNFFLLLDQLIKTFRSDDFLFPDTWLITSIDKFWKDGKPRFSPSSPNHYDSNAMDIIPLNEDGSIMFNVPLNRNLMFLDLFQFGYFKLFKTKKLPIIAAEADHFHLDVLHTKEVVRMRTLRSFNDKDLYHAAEVNPTLNLALSDNALQKLAPY